MDSGKCTRERCKAHGAAVGPPDSIFAPDRPVRDWVPLPPSRSRKDFTVTERPAALTTNVSRAGLTMPLDPPIATPAAQSIPCPRPGRRPNALIGITPHGPRAHLPARRPPLGAVPVARRKGMGDLVQDRVAHLGHFVQQHQRARQRDCPLPIPARPEPPAGVIEAERPTDEPVLGHQRSRELCGVMGVQGRTPVRGILYWLGPSWEKNC